MLSGDLMLADLSGTFAAFLLFPLIIFVPGFVAGFATGALNFRDADFPQKILLSVVFSVAVCPIATYALARTGSFLPVWCVYAAVWAVFPWLVSKMDLPRAGKECAAILRKKWVVPAAALWIAVSYASLADVRIDAGLSQNVMVFDYVKHFSVTDAITRTGVPPANPSFYPGEPIALFYYYFWFLLCSLVDQLGGAVVGPRHAVQAGTIWAGFALMAVLLLHLRFMAARGGAVGIRPLYGLALFLLLVTGLDIVPTVIFGVIHMWTGTGPGIQPDLEWWNEQVSAWVSTLLWVPHHAAALVACLTGFLLLRDLASRPFRRKALPACLVAALAFASAAGLSVWVTVVAAAVFAAWTGLALILRQKDEFIPHLLVGVSAVVIALPYLLDLASASHLQGAPVRAAVREFWPITRMSEWFGAEAGCNAACLLLVLPVNYALELGFVLFAVLYYWRARLKLGGLSRHEAFSLVLVGVSVLTCTFLRSDIHNNDLGWRGFLFAQFMMLLWSIPVASAILPSKAAREETGVESGGLWTFPGCKGPGPWARRLLAVALVLGLLGSTAEVLRIRIWPADEWNLVLRQTYEWIDGNTLQTAIVQHNPGTLAEEFHALYGHRQVAVADEHFGKLYGVDTELFDSVHKPVLRIFQKDTPLTEILDICKKFGIDLLLVKATDPVWDDRSSWVWTATSLHDTKYTKVFAVSKLEEAANPE